MKYLFGPVVSRRFGLSLGIDLSPTSKRCNFDCLYCELTPARPVLKYHSPPPPSEILEELERELFRFKGLDVITITANGEPTLYPYLEEIVKGVNRLKGKLNQSNLQMTFKNGDFSQKTSVQKNHLPEREKKDEVVPTNWECKSLILSNGSTIGQVEIRQILSQLDIVKLSLDTVIPATFKRLDRPVLKGKGKREVEAKLEEIITGMIQFRREFSGILILEILVVKGLNDREEEFQALNRVIREIKPDRVDISTIDRPPAYPVEEVPEERLWKLGQLIEGIPVLVPRRLTSDFNIYSGFDFPIGLDNINTAGSRNKVNRVGRNNSDKTNSNRTNIDRLNPTLKTDSNINFSNSVTSTASSKSERVTSPSSFKPFPSQPNSDLSSPLSHHSTFHSSHHFPIHSFSQLHLSREEILETLRRRPFTPTDVELLFDRETRQIFYQLVEEGVIIKKIVGIFPFFLPSQ